VEALYIGRSKGRDAGECLLEGKVIGGGGTYRK
jgi:hypothetical protein